MALVPVPKDDERDGLADPRRSDVDEWGRSEHMRELARQVYGPMYRSWHRVEWEGLEKIPTDGGALLVSNHAGAIPADAPAIMHGIEEELGRPVYGLADEIFKTMPVVGTLWSRVGRRARPPRQRLPAPPRAEAARPRVPRGHQGHRQDSTASATSCAASGAAASCRSPCAPACRWCRSRWSAPRRPCRPSSRSTRSPRRSASPTCRSPRTCSPSVRSAACCRSRPRSRSACSIRCPSTWSPISRATRGA